MLEKPEPFGINDTIQSGVDRFEAVQRLRNILQSEIWKDPKHADPSA